MAANKEFLVYAIGLESNTARAVYADLPQAVIRRRRPLRGRGPRQRRGPKPDAVLLDLSFTDVAAELAAIRLAWGDTVPVIGLGRRQPHVCVWRGGDLPELI